MKVKIDKYSNRSQNLQKQYHTVCRVFLSRITEFQHTGYIGLLTLLANTNYCYVLKSRFTITV